MICAGTVFTTSEADWATGGSKCRLARLRPAPFGPCDQCLNLVPGKATRDKGRRGQTEAVKILRNRDWNIADLTSGVSSEDALARDPEGAWWVIEIKNCAVISTQHQEQAKRQAQARQLPWMLMSKIANTSCWLVQQQDGRKIRCMVWGNHELG